MNPYHDSVPKINSKCVRYNSHGKKYMTWNDRMIFRECGESLHLRCPAVVRNHIYEYDPILGTFPSGKFENVYCECPCHAESVKNEMGGPK